MKSFLRLVFCLSFFGPSLSLFAQTATAISSAPPDVNWPRHETLRQDEILVRFNTDGTLGGGPIAFTNAVSSAIPSTDWTVRVNGAVVTISTVSVFATDQVLVRFNASSAPFNPPFTTRNGYPFLFYNDVVTISFTNMSGTLRTAGSNNAAANFANFTSTNNYKVPTNFCGDVINASVGPIIGSTVNQCGSTVRWNFDQFNWFVSLRFRNSRLFQNGQDLFITRSFGDSPGESFAGGYLSDGSFVSANATNTFISPTAFTGSNPAVVFTYRPDYTYANAFPTTGTCNWTASMFPTVSDGINLFKCSTPTSTGTRSVFTYDTDNANSGQLGITPSNSFGQDKVCKNTNVNVLFNDVTQLNCRAPIGNPAPNVGDRYVRIVYGSQSWAAPGNIPDIRVVPPALPGWPVGDVQMTNSTTGALLFPGGFSFTGAGGAGVPDANGAILVPSAVTVPTGTQYMAQIITQSSANQADFQRFYARMDYWDVCNPYIDPNTGLPGGPNGSTPPVSRSFFVEIITKPPPLGTNGLSVCWNSTNTLTGINFTAIPNGARTGVNWYRTNPKTGGTQISSAIAGTNNLTFPASSYTIANGFPVNFQRNLSGGAYYSVWATQINGTPGATCESEPVEIVIFQQPDISSNTPAFTTGQIAVCNGPPVNNQPYSATVPVTSKTISTSTFTNGSPVVLSTDDFWSTSFPSGVTLSPTQGGSITAGFNISPQPSTSVTNNITVQLQYTSGPGISVTSPITGPAPLPATYVINPQTNCPNTLVNRAVTVWGQSEGGSISANQVVCEGATPPSVTVAGFKGTVQNWEVQVNSGGFAVDGTLGTASTISPSVPIVGGVQTVYQYRASVQNGPVCSPVYSPVHTITVNPRPTGATIAGSAAICKGASTNLTVNITGGASPYQVRYNPGNVLVAGYVSGANISVSPTTNTTYTLVSVTDANGCTSAANSGSAAVAVKDLSAVLSFVNSSNGASQSICPPANFVNLRFTVSDANANPLTTYTVNFQDNLANSYTTGPGYVSGTPFTISNIASTRTFSIVSVTEAGTGCTTTNSGTVTISVGSVPSAATFSGGGSVCFNGTRNLTLTISGGVPPFSVTIPGINMAGLFPTGYTSGANIPVPTNLVGTTSYSVTAITDGCGAPLAGTVTGNPQTVTVTPPPGFDTSPTISPASVCDDGAATTDPILNFSMNSTSTEAGSYTLTYQVDAGANVTKVFSVNLANGDPNPAGAITFSEPALNATTPNPHTIRVVSITTPSGCQTTFDTDLSFAVNPRPAAPTGAVGAIACSSAGTGATLIVNPPVAGLTITWSSTAAPVFTAAAGVTGGTRGNQFTPASTSTATYHAFTQNDITLCRSSTSLAVQHTQDVAPTVSIAGMNQQNCTGTFTLAGNTPNTPGGEIGTWSVPGVAYLQSFSAYANGTVTSPALNGWTLNTSAPGLFAGGMGSFNVQSSRFEATNLDGSGTTGAEAVWLSPVINGTFPNLNISINLSGTPTHEASDYLRVFYRLNGGAEVALTNGNQNGNITGTVAATATGLNVTSSIQLVVRANNNAADETYRFDDIVMRDAGAPTITDPNLSNATVTNLPVGISTLTWTINSRFGVCPNSSSSVSLERSSLPTATPIAQTFCENVFGGGAVNNFDLTTLNSLATGGVGGLTVEWFFPGPPPAGAITPATTPQTITNGKIYHFRLTNSATGCQSSSTATFTVNPLPAAAAQSKAFCEDVIGGLVASGINLITEFNAAVTGGAANRSVAWFSDAGLTIPVGSPTAFSFGAPGPTSITLYAQVTNTITNCTNSTTINLSIKPKPISNPIQGNASACTGNSIILYQLDPTFNLGSTYTWSIAGTPPDAVQVFGGGGTNSANFFALLKFPSATGSVAIQVTETLNGCVGTPSTMTIAVNSAPAPNMITGPLQVCANQTGVSYAVASPNVTSTYTWNVSGGTIASAATSNINVDFATVSPVVVSVSETDAISGCVGAPATVNVTVNPRPVMTLPATINSCSGTVPASNFIAFPPSNFSWTVPPGGITGAITGTTVGSSGTGNLSETLVNTSGAVGSVTYSVTPTAIAAPNCAGSSQTVTVTVNPEPVLVSPQTKTICSGEAVNYKIILSPLNLPVGTAFNWSAPVMSDGPTQGSGSGGPVLATNALHIIDVLTNTTAAPITATYTITPSVSGCPAGTARTVVITVEPKPVVAAITNVVACPEQSIAAIDFSANTGGGETFNWTNNNTSIGLAASGTTNIAAFTAPANLTGSDIVGTISVTATRNGCTGAVRTFTITIRPKPVVNTVANVAVCAGQPISAIPFSANTGGGETFNWTNTNTAIGLAASGTGNIAAYTAPTNVTGADFVGTISVTATRNGCASDPMLFTVTVRAQPVVAAVSNIAVCSGPTASPVTIGPINFSANTGGGETFNWTNTNGSIGLPLPGTGNIAAYNAPSNTTNGNFVGTISVTATKNGCSSSPPITFTITVRPRPVISGSLDKAVCSGQPFAQTLATDGVSIGATNYNVSAVKDPALTGTATSENNLAANALASDNFVNTTSVPLTVVYTVTPNGTNGCMGDPRTVTLTVNPEPVLINPGISAVCSGDITNITLATNGTSVGAASYVLVAKLYSTDGGTTFAGPVPANFVDAGNVPITSIGNNTLIKDDKYTNTRATQVIVRYQIRPVSPVSSSGACNGATVNFDLPVNPQPILDPALNPTPVCSGVASGVTLGVAPGSVGAVTYNINSITFPGLTAGPGNTGIGSGKTANAIFNDVYVNTTASPVQAIYIVVPVSAAGCLGSPATVTLTIKPSPALLTGLNRTVCSTDVSGITLGSQGTSVPATTYNIVSVSIDGSLTQTAGNTGARTGVGQNEIVSDRFQNPTNTVRTVVYRIEPVSSAGCKGPQVDVTLSVEPTVTMITPPNASLCSNTPNTPSQTNIVLNSNTVPSAGAITFDYTVLAAPPGSVTGFLPAQANLPINFIITDKLVNNTNVVATVTYTITPKAVGAKGGVGCNAPTGTLVTIKVDPKPKLSVTPATQIVCEGVPTTMTLSSSTVPSEGTIQFTKMPPVPTGGMTLTSVPRTTYSNGEQIGDVWDNPTTLAQTVTYTFRASVADGLGCVSEDITASLTVNPSPSVAASAQLPICSSDFINITLTPDVANTICNYTVSAPSVISGATSGAGNLILQTLFYNSATPTVANSDSPVTVTYTVTPKANNCTGTPISIPVVVNPKPKILQLLNTYKICHDETLNIPLLSNVVGANYSWTLDSPPPAGVTGAVEQPVVGPATAINQTLTNTTGAQVSLTYTIKAFGPGATANQCDGDQKIIIVTVAPRIQAKFVNSPEEFICRGSSTFLNVEIDGQPPFSFVYNDGVSDLTISNSPNVKLIKVTPVTTTTYTLKSVIDAFGCSQPISGKSIKINVDQPDASFTVVDSPPLIRCNPFPYRFQYNQVAGRQYTWIWADGSPDSVYVATTTNTQVIKHTFTNLLTAVNKSFNVRLEVRLPAPFPECLASQVRTVAIFPFISADFELSNDKICSGGSVTTTNVSRGVTSHRWFWRLPGSTAENDVRTTPSVTYNLTNTGALNPQPIEIVYQAKNNGSCLADFVTTVRVYRGITPDFTIGAIPEWNGVSTVKFTNISIPLDLTQFRYDWNFGLFNDATPSIITQTSAAPLDVDYSTPGLKQATLNAVNIQAAADNLTCEYPKSKNFLIPIPTFQVDFDVTPKEACFPTTVKIVNLISTGLEPVNYLWEVKNKKTGATFTSNLRNPEEFNFTTPGEYTISYTVSKQSTGQALTAPLRDVKIYNKPIASFDLRPDVVFVPDTEMITFNVSNGANTYYWDFGDGGTSILKDPVYTYKIEGKYDVTLVASFDHGNNVVCRDTLVRKVTAKLGGQSKLPNAFTPNPNGPSPDGRGGNGTFNDVFLPIVRGIADEPDAYNLQVFDRWGNLLFESNSSTKGWDGYDQNGKIMPAGVYVYKLTLRFSDMQRTTQVGDVTLIR